MTNVMTTRLDDLPNLVDKPGCTMRRFGGAQAMLQEAKTPKGDSFAPHAHHNEQIVLILEGRLRLDVGHPGDVTSYELGPGDCMVIPPNVPHGGETLKTAGSSTPSAHRAQPCWARRNRNDPHQLPVLRPPRPHRIFV